MAREKSSERAEARRRYRAQLSESEAAAAEEAAALDAAAAETAAPNGPEGTDGKEQPGRLGLGAAIRLAARPADVSADLRAFPAIVTGTYSVLVPTVLIAVGAGAALAGDVQKDFWVGLLASVSVAPQPTMIPSFLAGMLTRRAAWLSGAFAGLLSALAFDLIVLIKPPVDAAVTLDAGFYLSMLLMGPIFGGAVGAFAGFYRRFLAFSAPPREGRRRPTKKTPKKRAPRRYGAPAKPR
ncbi:MAG: hypothetical protein RL338_1701 [Chloroflexota bacterium]